MRLGVCVCGCVGEVGRVGFGWPGCVMRHIGKLFDMPRHGAVRVWVYAGVVTRSCHVEGSKLRRGYDSKPKEAILGSLRQ